MTLKGLLRLTEMKHSSASDRFHSPWHSSGSGHSSSWKNKSGGGAAISALALLAFLFFLNTMQQTMMDSTMMEAMSNIETATILLRGNSKENFKDTEEFKKPNKNFDVENDNTFWNTQRLEVDANSNKHTKAYNSFNQ